MEEVGLLYEKVGSHFYYPVTANGENAADSAPHSVSKCRASKFHLTYSICYVTSKLVSILKSYALSHNIFNRNFMSRRLSAVVGQPFFYYIKRG